MKYVYVLMREDVLESDIRAVAVYNDHASAGWAADRYGRNDGRIYWVEPVEFVEAMECVLECV